MRAEKSVIQIGSSLAIIIPRALAIVAGLKKNGSVQMDAATGMLKISPVKKVKPVALRGIVAKSGINPGDFRAVRRSTAKAWSKRWKRM